MLFQYKFKGLILSDMPIYLFNPKVISNITQVSSDSCCKIVAVGRKDLLYKSVLQRL